MILRLETTAGEVLVVAGGRIAHPDTKADLTLAVGAGKFYPGLINAHDHLQRNHYPRLGSPPYEDAYAWGTDLHSRHAQDIERLKSMARRDALLFGALKNIIGGVTTVVHHDPWEADFDSDFPVRVARVRTLHSLGFERDWNAARAEERSRPGLPLCIHLAEGVNSRASAEVEELDRRGWLDERLLAVHCVGVDVQGIDRLRATRAGLVWCPTSNVFLFGRTAPQELLESGIDVLLGSDALLTGAGTLLDELRFARSMSLLDDASLLEAVGARAALRLGLPEPSLEPGAKADVVLLRTPPLAAQAGDVALVLVDGHPVLADADIGDVMVDRGTTLLTIGGIDKRVPAELATAAHRALELSPECARIFQ